MGFVGLGDQGAPIARAIAEGGFELHVWARRPGSLSALEGVSFVAHESLTDLGACDIVALCLREDPDAIEVAVDGGLLAAMRPGSVLVQHATGLPEKSRELAEHAARHGVEFVDAPVSGGHAAAVAKQLTTIVGGGDDVVRRCRPVFETFSKLIVHMGQIGAGQYGKLFNNTLMMMNHKNVIDVLALAADLELPLPRLLDVLRSGSASSAALTAFGPAITVVNAEHLRTLELIDMDLFAGAVESLGDKAKTVVRQAVAGAEGLPELTRVIG
ncbi:NAD(P)-dependent oxidoreductase [Kutzneria sp. CA-103260]|uniref:NAD(P)-dependent oxidoreductase n=1 Tax=Kutzneria sp. CA-103260 TaxID=2802641 RepID=UPI001BAAB29D|nr:NAD(P)-dependent oxidoreductase [Kutzneria sp. CA-103260]